MAALVAAIHENTVLSPNIPIDSDIGNRSGVDGRHKAGHDGTVGNSKATA